MFATINGIGLFGMSTFPVGAEISVTPGLPGFDIIGLPDLAVQESKARITAALVNTGVTLPGKKLVVNLAPASVRKTGSSYDLTILTAILAALDIVKIDTGKSVFVGELSLGGGLLPVNGSLTMALSAKKSGMSEIFLPEANAREASVAGGIKIFGVRNVHELILHLTGQKSIVPAPPFTPEDSVYDAMLDFSDVRGQESVKQAIEAAAAGFHNILMIGPPGTGKSMIAKRISSILPEMTFDESVETTQVFSVAGLLDPARPLMTSRPFRAVGHTSSAAGLIGGGSVPKPGEISLATGGVLFLDELPEFDRRTLETLRQPLEDGVIHISRAGGKSTYPCNFMLVAAMNPCPCGNYGHPVKKCTCSDKQVNAYLSKISGPVLDRIDIQAEVNSVSYDNLSEMKKSEESRFIRERVMRAREIQAERFRAAGLNITANAKIPSGMLHEICRLSDDASTLIRVAFERLGLSARAYDRVLKVARTVADLSASEMITREHAARAIQYRSLDKKYWKR